MSQFFMYFWQICLMQQSPERAPVSSEFVTFIVIVYIVCSMTLLTVSGQEFRPVQTAKLVLLGLMIQSLSTWLLMAFKRHYDRFRATLVSLLGTNSILVLMLVPVNLLLMLTDNETAILAIEAVYWTIFLWWITVAGYILRKALNISLLQGMAIAFTIELVSLVSSNTLLNQENATSN